MYKAFISSVNRVYELLLCIMDVIMYRDDDDCFANELNYDPVLTDVSIYVGVGLTVCVFILKVCFFFFVKGIYLLL